MDPAVSASPCESCACGHASTVVGRPCPFVLETCERGATLFREGDPADRVYVIRRGTVVLTRASGEAGARARAVRRTGAFVGLEALIAPRYLDSARASEPTAACRAPLAAVDDWLGAPGTPARLALEQLLRSEVDEPLHAASPDGTAIERVARWILDEAQGGAPRALPRRDVAGLLGMVPETLSRALAALVRAGAITTNRRHLRVVDAQALRTAAGLG
jgi:CRP/FNR family transcriptional regulator